VNERVLQTLTRRGRHLDRLQLSRELCLAFKVRGSAVNLNPSIIVKGNRYSGLTAGRQNARASAGKPAPGNCSNDEVSGSGCRLLASCGARKIGRQGGIRPFACDESADGGLVSWTANRSAMGNPTRSI